MKTVLEEEISDDINADHIERRVKDWEERLSALFGTFIEWLPHGWEAQTGAPYLMNEMMMRQFGIPAKQLPTLELHHPSKPVIKLVPPCSLDHRHKWPSRCERFRTSLSHC